ncbi:MAG TPA: penicillin-binding transpeptidase domain-containing protein [Polyangiaceae bacterium]|nr:penicillin-binding transpeptidase domain-containing protein [Polyangiaceae bacterium]
MEDWSFVGLALRAALLFSVTLGATFALTSASATLRRCVLLLGVAAALSLPLLSRVTAGREVVQVAAPRVVARVVAEALSSRRSAAPGPEIEGARQVARPSLSWPTAVLVLWCLGVVVVLSRMTVGLLGARRLVRRARAGEEGLHFSTELEGPVVVGLFAPLVLLPENAAGWQSERLRAVLLHESAHVRRRDGLALLLAQLACALYWFIPLSWWAFGRLRRECELAADEDVLAAGFRATSYAEHLLAVARTLHVPAGAVAMAARPSELGRRIQVLISREQLPSPLSRNQLVALATAAFVVLALVACTGTTGVPAPTPPVSALVPSGGPLQAIAIEEAKRVHSETGARRVAIVVLDARSGRVLALSDDRLGDPVVPASALKPLTVALALDAGSIAPSQRFDCGNGQRAYGSQTLRDAGQYGLLDLSQILAVSSNVGVSRIFDALGGERLRDGLNRFHVGAPAEIPDASLRGAIIAIGEGSFSTPLAMASAYGVFANDGVYTAPNSARSERVLKVETARSVRTMLESVVTGEQATGKAARVEGVRVGGKTGTSDDPDCEACAQGPGLFATFVGIVPIDAPKYVIYVGVGQPSAPGTGGTLAAPVFARLAARALAAGG